jgi:hypothetical protein
MIVSEPESVAQPIQTVSTDDGISGTSTFKGQPERGGWVPIFTKYRFGSPVITEWICPVCNVLIGQSRTCSHCGLERLGIPSYKDLSRPDREHKSNYKLWFEELEDGGSVRRITEDKHQSSDRSQSSTTSRSR